MKFEVKNLSCARGGKYLFRNLNFSLSSGQIFHIKGQNGSGKTTLLKILCGLLPSDKGKVYWNSQEINKSIEYYSNLSFLGHKEGLRKTLTATENITNGIYLANSIFNQEKLNKMLIKLNLLDYHSIPCANLSAGQRRKVVLATLALKQKPLWILDEPFTALDHATVKIVDEVFLTHVCQGGIIILASHTEITYANKTINL